VLGPNGVGKTTLFKTVLKLIPPLSGEVLIDGESIRHWSSARLARSIGYVSQVHNAAFEYTVFDIVLMGRISHLGLLGTPKQEDLTLTETVIDDIGLSHLSDKIYTEISGGERQLALIARALNSGSKFLMLDEPTASLDYKNTILVLKKVKELSQKKYSILMTTHDPDVGLLLNSRALLLNKEAPPILGDASEVITVKNLKTTYDIDVEVKTFAGKDGEKVRLCVPVI
jgi:iron complex transport system ATP-binding protein